ncbi:MAG: hypothetical protein BWK80_57830 [Desulfobacteraceae bacterium IS3]|nr:MAG: hypothetical protein BWK80_57830 [Desulfobacteraceae bacterium IS3]
MNIWERRELFFRGRHFSVENGEFDEKAFEAHEQAFRDTLTAGELERLMLTEGLAVRLIKARNARGGEQCAECCLEAGRIIAEFFSEENSRYMI